MVYFFYPNQIISIEYKIKDDHTTSDSAAPLSWTVLSNGAESINKVILIKVVFVF